MYAYKVDEKGNIIEEILDVKTSLNGYIMSEKQIDATKYILVNGSLMIKPVEVPQKEKEIRIKRTNEQKLQDIRDHRNWLLSLTDWTMTIDAPISAEKQAEYKVYRQALRDMTARADLDLDNPKFPVKPQ